MKVQYLSKNLRIKNSIKKKKEDGWLCKPNWKWQLEWQFRLRSISCFL